MKKLWRRVTKGSPSRSGEASPKSSSTRGSVASLNIGYEVKDLRKLHKAAWRGDLNKVKQLAKKDPSPLDKENRTPLHLACIQGHEYIVQELLEWKAKTNIGDNQSKTPLMRAVEFQQEGCVNLLLSFNVDVDTTDAQGNTPLHLAVDVANLSIISMLIKAGASLNTRNKDGFSPLHLAVRNKHKDVCHLLLKEKVEVNIEDTNLRTPLMHACQDGSVALVKLLLEYNADTSHKDSKGWTADDCAVIQGHHACSQLISDHNLKMSRVTPTSTPRSSSQPPSLLNTPRDKNSIGLPVLDGGDADSDNETISKVSGAAGSDSWADSPDVSVSGPKGKEESDIDENVFEDEKQAVPKINLAKFAKNIHVSESDTEGESLRGQTPRQQFKTEPSGSAGKNADDSSAVVGAAVGKPSSIVARQMSSQSHMSAEDSSWGDSPVTPRKLSAPKVSFKKDGELSEIRDIVEHDVESDIDPVMNVFGGKTSTPLSNTVGKKPEATAEVGYVPSASATITAAVTSADKLRAFMEELGISDVDDISEMSEDASAPPLPASPPPKMTLADHGKEDSEWDSSVVSGMMSTPRPGILKKEVTATVNQPTAIETTIKSDIQLQQVKNQKPQKPADPAEESEDESSAWDTTEADVPQVMPDLHIEAVAAQQKESLNEWDSDLEDMINPVVRATAPGTTPSLPLTLAAKEHTNDEDWDSTFEAATPRAHAGLFYSEVNMTRPSDVPEPVQVPADVSSPAADELVPKPVTVGTVKGGMTEPEGRESSESSWDSEADELPSNAGVLPTYTPSVDRLFGTTSPQKTQGQIQGQEILKSDPESDDTETISSWEKERKLAKMGLPKVTSPVHQRIADDEVKRKEQEDLENQLKIQREEEERKRKSKDDEHAMKDQKVKDEVEGQAEPRKKSEDEDVVFNQQEIDGWKEVSKTERVQEFEAQGKLDEPERQQESEIQWKLDADERQQEWKLGEIERHQNTDSQWGLDDAEKHQEVDGEWELDDAARQQEIEIQWKLEEAERQQEIESIWKKDEAHMTEKLQNEAGVLTEDPDDLMDNVLFQQQELHRIDEQFQRERAEREKREEEERKWRMEKEEEEKKFDQQEVKDFKENRPVTLRSLPPALLPKPALPVRTQTSNFSGVYDNIGGSAAQEIRQRLQVIQPNVTPLSSTGPFYPRSYALDDEESLPSDTPGDERSSIPQFYHSGFMNSNNLFGAHEPLDDDALSYTSTEFEEHVQSSPSYARDRDMLANINISDPNSLLKVQEYVRETRRSLDQERNQRVILESKLKLSNKEKAEIARKLENLTHQKSELEQTKLDLEAKIRSLEYNITEEAEKRMNAEVLLNKTKEHLAKKESQLSSELEVKQKAELAMRNLQIEMRTANNTITELKEEKEELQRQVTHANNARLLQEQISEDQQKLLQKQQQQSPKDSDYLESSFEFNGDLNKLKAELYALKMEMDRQRSRFKDEISLMGAENEELMTRVEELRNDIKLNEEALAHATMQYNIQVASLRSDVSTANSMAERERTAREKLEAEIESLKTRLLSANQEMEKAIRARNEIEREQQREKEVWSREMDRKEDEVAALKDNVQHLSQRLTASDAKLNTVENELHVSNTSLMERASQLQHFQQELERQKSSYSSLDQSHRLEKENSSKLQAKLESLQEKLGQQQHENLSLRQQLDTLRLNAGSLPGSDTNEKLNNILTSLRAESDRARASLEEKNSGLLEQVARLKEEAKGSEVRRSTLEQDLRRLHDEHSDMVKKLSHAEASLQIALKAKDQLEQERIQLKMELEKLQQRYESTHDKSVEAQARVSELVDRLEKAENNSLYSHQQLANTSVNFQGLVKSKLELDDSMQQLQIENAKLEAELKYEKQRADMLYQDLQDSQKVRSSLEALCANLKSTSAHLEDRLGSENGFEDSRLDEETAARVIYKAEAQDLKSLYDQEIKSRSKLGLRIADLERNKHISESRIGEEKNRANLAKEERRTLEARLEAETEKSQQLQRDVNVLKTHLKSARKKIKDHDFTDSRMDDGNLNMHVSSEQHQAQFSEPNGDIRSELEAKYRKELNRKLDDVNRFLDSQSQLRDRLDSSRTEIETHLLSDKRRLEEEINNLRIKFEQAIAQRETKEMEARRFRELYESEMKWRIRISDQLQLATERSMNLKSKLNNERQHRSRLTGSIGNLSSPLLVSNSFDLGRINGFHDDELSSRIKAELDRSIAKHLEAAPHDHKPVIRPVKEPTIFSSSLTQSSKDYIDILKRKYCV